jgi:diketogulonate reductase-like aldo/keto reductase
LQRGLDLGINHIDTAEMYGSGAAEELVGQAIAGRRGSVFLVSKVLPQHASAHGTLQACDRSLARLQTDHLDCYLLHWRGSYPLEETIAAFEHLRRQGKILSWGVSNFNVSDLEEALNIAGPHRIACNQVLYHLQERAIEHAVLPWCEKRNVVVVAYSPCGHGNFPGPRTKGGRLLKQIADGHNATPRQLALSFLTRHSSVFAILKASNPQHTEENAGAARLHLTKEELAAIDQEFPLRASETRTPHFIATEREGHPWELARI